jgi:hypothetical protein
MAQRGKLPGAVKEGARWLIDRRAVDAELNDRILSSDNNRGASAA